MTEPRKPRTRKSKGSDLELGLIVAAGWLRDQSHELAQEDEAAGLRADYPLSQALFVLADLLLALPQPKDLTVESFQRFIADHHLWGREGWARANSFQALLNEAHKREVVLREALGDLFKGWLDEGAADNTVIRLAILSSVQSVLIKTSESATAWLKAHDREVLEKFIESLAVELPRVTYPSSKGYDRTGAFRDYHIKAIQGHLRAAILGEEEP